MNPDVDSISKAWLAYLGKKRPEDEWAVEAKEDILADQDFETTKALVLSLCSAVSPDAGAEIECIGAGPLESFISAHPTDALAFVEEDVADNVVLRTALTAVWSQGDASVRNRIDRILAPYGERGAEL